MLVSISKNYSRFYKEYKRYIINCEEYTSSKARSQRSTAIAAKWPNVLGIDSQGEAPFRIMDIISFVEHDIVVSSLNAQSANSSPTTKTHILAHLQWYGDHPRRQFLHSSVTICSTVFDHESCASFMPVSRIMCRAAVSSPLSLTFDYGEDRVFVTIPLVKYVQLE